MRNSAKTRLGALGAAVAALATTLVATSPAQTTTPTAAPHFSGSATASLAASQVSGGGLFNGPDNTAMTSAAQASTLGLEGLAAKTRATAGAPGTAADQTAGSSDNASAQTAGMEDIGPFASAHARRIDLATGVCPPAGTGGERVLAAARTSTAAPASPGIAIGRSATASTVSLVPAEGQPGLAVRAVAEGEFGSVRIGDAYELRVLKQPRLVAEATGSEGGASIQWDAPVIDVIDLATGESVARLDEETAGYNAPDDTEFDGHTQPFRITLVAPHERTASWDGGFARARAALVRVRFQPGLGTGQTTIGPMSASATAPVGGVTTCDGGAPLPQDRAAPHVLIYDKTHGYEHVSKDEANRALGEIANQTQAFSYEITDDVSFLRPDKLAGVDMVMFNNNVADMPVTVAHKNALKNYLLAGGGAGGIHSATDANYNWSEYGEMFGARFDGHPHMGYMQEWGKTRLVVEDQESPITSGWHGQESFQWADEYYRWRENDPIMVPGATDANVLLSLDTKTVLPGTQQGINPYGAYRVEYQPVAWTKTFRGAGRVFYTNMGHNGFAWAAPEFRTMALEGIKWVTAGS